MNRPTRRSHDDDAASRRAARFIAAVAYDGSEFQGWQCQPNGRGVQDAVEARLSRLLGAPAIIAGAGRTDAGVHARAQVFHFDVHASAESASCRGVPSPLALARRAAADGTGTDLAVAVELERCLCGLPENAGLPPSVRVLAVRPAPPHFHARDSCVGKRYVYTVREGVPSPFEARYCWALGLRRGASLDVEKMRAAAAVLRGVHDFTRLAVLSADDPRSPRKRLRMLRVDRCADEGGGDGAPAGPRCDPPAPGRDMAGMARRGLTATDGRAYLAPIYPELLADCRGIIGTCA